MLGVLEPLLLYLNTVSEAPVGDHEEACKKQKRWCWQEVRSSKAAEGVGETQLACGLVVGWCFGWRRRNPERGCQSAVWKVRSLGLDGRLGAHPIYFACSLSSSALGVMEAPVL